ncbi:hypothetical protein ACFL6K_00770 [Candidatus Latescibacterota bacterium]
MTDNYVYKTYSAEGSADSVRSKFADYLLTNGYIRTGTNGSIEHFRYPSIIFSSKKPLTCISRLSVEILGNPQSSSPDNGKIVIKIGANFTKIRYFNVIGIATLCFLIPAVLGYLQNGIPGIPPVSYIGIPLGFMIHYHVRMRSFSTIKRAIQNLKYL